MIPRAQIIEWRATAPWLSDAQVEQDLVISRALVELFSSEAISTTLAFRGGTALHKLYLAPATRYSEDIDLVQMAAGPIGPSLDSIKEILNPLLGEPHRDRAEGSMTLRYRVESEIPPVAPLRLKVEINTREHFAVRGYVAHRFSVDSSWFSRSAEITTFDLNELLGTKLRALYQRRKGRDLFDLWLGLTLGKADPKAIIEVFQHCIASDGLTVSGAEFKKNLAAKMKHEGFLGDTDSLLRAGVRYDVVEARELIEARLLRFL